jgi:hypothetical protein
MPAVTTIKERHDYMKGAFNPTSIMIFHLLYQCYIMAQILKCHMHTIYTLAFRSSFDILIAFNGLPSPTFQSWNWQRGISGNQRLHKIFLLYYVSKSTTSYVQYEFILHRLSTTLRLRVTLGIEMQRVTLAVIMPVCSTVYRLLLYETGAWQM